MRRFYGGLTSKLTDRRSDDGQTWQRPAGQRAFTERHTGLLAIPSREGNLPCILLRFRPQCQRPLRHRSCPALPLSVPEPSPNVVGVDDSRVRAGRSAVPRTTLRAPRWRSPRQVIKYYCIALRAVLSRPSLPLSASPRATCSRTTFPLCPCQSAPHTLVPEYQSRRGTDNADYGPASRPRDHH